MSESEEQQPEQPEPRPGSSWVFGGGGYGAPPEPPGGSGPATTPADPTTYPTADPLSADPTTYPTADPMAANQPPAPAWPTAEQPATGTWPTAYPTHPTGTGPGSPPPPAGWGTPGTAGHGGAPPWGGPNAGGGGTWGPWGPWGPPPGGYWAPPPAPLTPRARRVRAVTGTVVAAVLAAAVGIVVGRAAFTTGNPSASSNAVSPFGGSSGQGTTPAGPSDANAIAAKVDPGLIDIDTVIGYDTDLEGAGTGMVVTSTGEVITNNHVIDEATQIKVTDIGNGQTYNATVLGYDHNGDIAVLQLQNASGLSTVTFGNSSSVATGDGVVAIGNAGGVGGTPSVAPGTITALNQSITASDQADQTSEQLSGLLETDADIQPGDSGGPLVNTSGQVIGMDTAASSGFSIQGGSATQGYAIPVDTVSTVAKQIESGKSTTAVHIGATGFIGVEVASGSCESTGFGGGFSGGFPGFGGGSASSGALVCGTVAGTPAASAGLTEGDVITAVDGTTVSSPSDLTDDLIAYHPGDKVQLTYTTPSGSQQTVTITLASGPPQ